MIQQDSVIENLQKWGEEQDSVITMILTGSRANPNTVTDIFSDYDVQLFVKDVAPYMVDDWLSYFGNIMIKWPLKPMPTFSEDWITRLVLFENKVRIDFQITAKSSIEESAFDSGFKVLVDKQGLTKDLHSPTFSEFMIKKPNRDEYDALVNEFFWDAIYIAKYLRRDEIYFAKYMFDSVIRFQQLGKIIEWYIGSQNNWAINTGKYGRFFKRHLDPGVWIEIEATFADANIENNWAALFNVIRLFRKLAKYVAESLGYKYPTELDERITEYCAGIKGLIKK
jgi:aminoglycoside 6-adenylyltransferase